MGQLGVIILFLSQFRLCVNKCKTRSNCIHEPTCQKSSLVSTSGVIRCCKFFYNIGSKNSAI